MKMKPLILALASAAIAGTAHVALAASTPAGSDGYWFDSSGHPIRNALGECVRTSSWSPDKAIAPCDPQRKTLASVESGADNRDHSRGDNAPPAPEDMEYPEHASAARPEQEYPRPDGLALAPGANAAPDPRRSAGADAGYFKAGDDAEQLLGPNNVATETHFAFDHADISYKEEKRLDEVIGTLARLPDDAVIQVIGHTDAVGSPDYNIELSLRRAKALREYLVNNGIEPRRIILAAMGESQPVATNATAHGRALNRRAEIQVTRLAGLDPNRTTHVSAL